MNTPDNPQHNLRHLLLPPSHDAPPLGASYEDVSTFILESIDMKQTDPNIIASHIYTYANHMFPGSGSEFEKVVDIMKEAHGETTRKGNPQMLYINHPLNVTLFYILSFPYHQQYHKAYTMLQTKTLRDLFIDGGKIALLHDTFEDTHFSSHEARKNPIIGEEAVRGIEELTKATSETEGEHYQGIDETFSIKAADFAINTLDFNELLKPKFDPKTAAHYQEPEWGEPKRTVTWRLDRYLTTAEEHLVDRLRQENPFLHFLIQKIIQEAKGYISHLPPGSSRRQVS